LPDNINYEKGFSLLKLYYLPQQGEIMNIIEIHRGYYQFFEVIIRDIKLKRKLFLLDPSGKIISSHKL